MKKPPIRMELKVVPYYERWYTYEVYHEGRLICKRKHPRSDFVIGIVAKEYRHPYPYSIPHLFSSMENFEKYGRYKNVKVYGLAIRQEMTVG